jgi:hypothetical protein
MLEAYATVEEPESPSEVKYDAAQGVSAEPVYGCGITGQVIVTVEVACVIVNVAALELPAWFASPA